MDRSDPARGWTLCAAPILLAAVLAAAVAGFVAVDQHTRCAALGYQIREVEASGRRLSRDLDGARGRVAALRSPKALLRRARELGLALYYPGADARPPLLDPSADELLAGAR